MNSQCQALFKSDSQSLDEPTFPNELVHSEDKEEKRLGVLISQVDFIGRLSGTNSPEEFNKEILELVSSLGFTDYALVCKTSLNSIEAPHSSLPKELFKEYEKGRFCHTDMVLDYIHGGEAEPVRLSMIKQVIESTPLMTYTFEKNLQILALYKKFNIEDAYVIPVSSDRGSGYNRAVFSVMGLGMSREKFAFSIRRYSTLLRVLADAVSFISETHYLPSRPSENIKAKPLKLLCTMAMHDVSLAEAAENLCISLDTANKHMALAKRAMGTNSQANAVYLAIRRGLINV